MNFVQSDILDRLPDPQRIATALLLDLKRIFSSTPHSEISAAGRRLARPIGGDGARADMFDEQYWKDEWGTWNTLRWCCDVLPVRGVLSPSSRPSPLIPFVRSCKS